MLASGARATPDAIASRRSLVPRLYSRKQLQKSNDLATYWRVPRRILQVLLNGAPERVGDSSWYDVQDFRHRLDYIYMYVDTPNTITLLHKPLTSSHIYEFASGYYAYIR